MAASTRPIDPSVTGRDDRTLWGTAVIRVVEQTLDGEYAPVRVRDYRPSEEVVGAPLVWLHGGGFSNGGLDQRESDLPARAWAASGRFVRTVEYRLAVRPKPWRRRRLASLPNRFPAGLEDVLAAIEDLASSHDAIVVGGASAGACLAVAAAMHQRDAGRVVPAGLVLAYGNFHAVLPLDPHVEAELHGFPRLLFRRSMVRAINVNYVGDVRAVVPGAAFPGGTDLRGLPPALMLDADNDRLRASGTAFAGELRRADVEVDRQVVRGSTHGFFDKPSSAAFRAGVNLVARWCDDRDGRASRPDT